MFWELVIYVFRSRIHTVLIVREHNVFGEGEGVVYVAEMKFSISQGTEIWEVLLELECK
jgi:hypothetical protein